MDFSEVINRGNKRFVSSKELMGILLHRYPMLMLDTILDYDFTGGGYSVGNREKGYWSG